MPYVSEDLLRCDYVVLISPPSTSLFRLHRAIKYPPNQRSPPPVPQEVLGVCSPAAGPAFKPSKSSTKPSPYGLPGKTLPSPHLRLITRSARLWGRSPQPRCAAPAHLPYFTAVIGTVQSSP